MRIILLIVPLLAMACGGICLQNVTCFRNVPDGGCERAVPRCCSGSAACEQGFMQTLDNVDHRNCATVPNNPLCG